MKRLLLIPLVIITLGGCKAMDSLIVHPLQVIHQEHENQEWEEQHTSQSNTNSTTP